MLKSIAAALVIAASLPTAALTAQPREVKQEVVRFDDLDLARPSGIAKLERRISGAVRRVCGYHEARSHSFFVSKDVSDCMTDALAGARKDVALKTGTTIRKG